VVFARRAASSFQIFALSPGGAPTHAPFSEWTEAHTEHADQIASRSVSMTDTFDDPIAQRELGDAPPTVAHRIPLFRRAELLLGAR
jgi:hypothetical protein